MNTFLDAGSNLCYTQINVEQDHNLDGDDCRGVYSSGWFRLAVVHPFQCASTTSVQAGLLRQQNVLRDFKRA